MISLIIFYCRKLLDPFLYKVHYTFTKLGYNEPSRTLHRRAMFITQNLHLDANNTAPGWGEPGAGEGYGWEVPGKGSPRSALNHNSSSWHREILPLVLPAISPPDNRKPSPAYEILWQQSRNRAHKSIIDISISIVPSTLSHRYYRLMGMRWGAEI